MYRGWWDTISSIITSSGFSANTIAAITKAFSAPTSTNIQGVIAAFQAEGTYPPPELLNALYGRQAEAAADNPYYTAGTITSTVTEWLPWILGGGLLIFAISSRRRR